MKKIIMILTLAICAAIAIPTVANAQSATTTSTEKTAECCKEKKECPKEKKECCKKDKKGKKGKKGMRKAKDGKMAKANRMMVNPQQPRMMKDKKGENPLWEGITLTEAQKAQIKELKMARKEAMKSAKAEAKAQSRDAKMKSREEMDRQIAKILDKDQLKQYEANKAAMHAKRAASKKG